MSNYLGLDTSSKAIHGAVVDDSEALVGLYKWSSTKKLSNERFPEIVIDFSEEIVQLARHISLDDWSWLDMFLISYLIIANSV